MSYRKRWGMEENLGTAYVCDAGLSSVSSAVVGFGRGTQLVDLDEIIFCFAVHDPNLFKDLHLEGYVTDLDGHALCKV